MKTSKLEQLFNDFGIEVFITSQDVHPKKVFR